MNDLRGMFAIMVTPFDEKGQVDVESLRSLVDFELRADIDGLVVLGILGEAHKLSEAERDLVIDTVLDEVEGRVPVVVGTSFTGTDIAVMLSQRAENKGAAAVMVAPPTNLNNLDAVFEYYQRVADGLRGPMVVQDEPTQSGVLMPAPFLARLVDEIPQARYIKLEELPTPPKIGRVLELTEQSAGVFGGMGGIHFLEELERGAIGTMTGFAFPEVLVSTYRYFEADDLLSARRVFYRYLPLIRYEGQPKIGLALRKEILRMRGVIRSNTLRHPGSSLDEGTKTQLLGLLDYLDLKDKPPVLDPP